MSVPQLIHYLADIIGYSVMTLIPLIGLIWAFFSIAKRARKKVDIDMDNYSHKPVEPLIEDFEKCFIDNDIAGSNLKKSLEYSSN